MIDDIFDDQDVDLEWAPQTFCVKRYKAAHWSVNQSPRQLLDNSLIEISEGKFLSKRQLEKFIQNNMHATRCANCNAIGGVEKVTLHKTVDNDGKKVYVCTTCQEPYCLKKIGLVPQAPEH